MSRLFLGQSEGWTGVSVSMLFWWGSVNVILGSGLDVKFFLGTV